MPTPKTKSGETLWELPPLILHPFNERVPPSALLQSSRAALMLSGLIPHDGTDPEDLARRLLSGRYSEVRMLFFLGKDVCRWLEQCMEWAGRSPDLAGLDIRPQSFARFLTEGPPEDVQEKLAHWGVSDYPAIFSRAIGLNTLFLQPPAFETLSEQFLRNYHCYADALFRCYLEAEPHGMAGADRFHFCLYASGEYSRLLESEWEADNSDKE